MKNSLLILVSMLAVSYGASAASPAQIFDNTMKGLVRKAILDSGKAAKAAFTQKDSDYGSKTDDDVLRVVEYAGFSSEGMTVSYTLATYNPLYYTIFSGRMIVAYATSKDITCQITRDDSVNMHNYGAWNATCLKRD